mmetsp:Transcript_3177/g.6242  ORF Transcript_3177/g.6242 Transcript_3177/m.6242 type:complete len:334 (+) Transcript_3177:190-1191(+)
MPLQPCIEDAEPEHDQVGHLLVLLRLLLLLLVLSLHAVEFREPVECRLLAVEVVLDDGGPLQQPLLQGREALALDRGNLTLVLRQRSAEVGVEEGLEEVGLLALAVLVFQPDLHLVLDLLRCFLCLVMQILLQLYVVGKLFQDHVEVVGLLLPISHVLEDVLLLLGQQGQLLEALVLRRHFVRRTLVHRVCRQELFEFHVKVVHQALADDGSLPQVELKHHLPLYGLNPVCAHLHILISIFGLIPAELLSDLAQSDLLVAGLQNIEAFGLFAWVHILQGGLPLYEAVITVTEQLYHAHGTLLCPFCGPLQHAILTLSREKHVNLRVALHRVLF